MSPLTDNTYIVENNTYILAVKTDPKDFLEIEVGDRLQADFYPQVKIKRWDDEVNLSVRFVDSDIDIPQVSFNDTTKKIEYVKQAFDCVFYDQGDSYEFEIILKETPKSNVLSFTLQSKEVDFFYQRSLRDEPSLDERVVTITETDWLDENGDVIMHRPENVVGSYAVYHQTKGGMNLVDGKSYQVGKVGHIYRPRIVDSIGTVVWGDLNIDQIAGTLSVTIPQEFLDNAVYPVYHAAGLTFGYTSAGATGFSFEQYVSGGRYTPTGTGTLTGTSMTAWTNPSSKNADFKMAVYDNGSGDTDASTNLVSNGTTDEHDTSTTGLAERSANFTVSPTFTSGTAYRLYGWSKGGSYDHWLQYDSSISGAYGYDQALTYGTWPDPTNVSARNERRFSIYCTFTESGSGTASNVQQYMIHYKRLRN